MAGPFRMCARVSALDARPGGAPLDGALLARALGDRAGVVLLDSAAGQGARWTVMGLEPLRGAGLPSDLAGLESWLAQLEPGPGDAIPGPFAGGFLGSIAYDCGVAGEGLVLPPDPQGLPRILGGLFTDFIVLDRDEGQAHLVLGDAPGDGRSPVEVRRQGILEALARASAPEGCPDPGLHAGPLVRQTAPALHAERVRAVQAQIAAGEVYQANLAHRITAPFEGTAAALFLALRQHNPAPYMGFVDAPEGAVVSSSPELLLESDGATVRSRPIKGTRPRSADPAQDRALAEELLASAKDHAELAMIVDLVRNDCSRVCVPGSVQVGPLPDLESHASVHHLAADVTGRLAPGRTALDALLALFPGGSITGAPKLRAMEVLAELEVAGRGHFTGTMGMLDLRGHACFNILIRTLSVRWDGAGASSGEVSFQVGGGITAASDPWDEEHETRVKGQRMARALGSDLFEEGAGGAPDGAAQGAASSLQDRR